jgi:hypothetical protein
MLIKIIILYNYTSTYKYHEKDPHLLFISQCNDDGRVRCPGQKEIKI